MNRSVRGIFSTLLVASFGHAQAALVAEADQPARWNQWRGPARSGQFTGPAWPDSLKGGLERQWRVELGPSYSGPIVDAERVYTTETVDKEREVVRAHDRKTGEEVWNASWKGAMKVPFFAQRNGSWIRSTPALDDGRLYVAGIRDVLVCLEAKTGDRIWRVDLTERFETPTEAFGFVCSPMVQGGAVYVQCAAGFAKLDKRTGKTIWLGLKEAGGMMGGAFSSPVFAKVAGVEQCLVQTRSRLCGVDDETGEELWGVNVRTFRAMNILTPTPYKDGVFTSAYGGRAHYFGLGSKGDEMTVSEKWSSRAQGYMTSPVVIDDHAYLYLRSKRFTCVDLMTGETTWTSPPIGDEYWSLVAQGDRMLALTNTGELCLIKANPKEFELIDRVEVAESETWAHLAVDESQLFVRELEGLIAYEWR